MKEKLYNLQVPIDTDLELALKKLAKEDDRTLRVYCRRILQDHVDQKRGNIEVSNNGNKESNQSEVIKNNEESKKKPRVGALTKK